jgi:hypothetical protein
MPTQDEKPTELKPTEPNATPNLPVIVELASHNSTPLAPRTKSLKVVRMVSKPVDGMTYNPLLRIPRNSPCPCMSGKKFKACCISRLAPIVSLADAKIYKEQMSKPDLVFMTPDNEEIVKARLAPALKAKMDKEHEYMMGKLREAEAAIQKDYLEKHK